MRILPQVNEAELAMFEKPIQSALANYEAVTGGNVLFDISAASHLVLTPDKPNSARSSTQVMHGDDGEAATLTVVAFAPYDATGDDKTYTADQLETGMFPNHPKYFPRSKKAVHTEAHMTIASKLAGETHKPVKFAGHLSMIGLVGVGNNRGAKPYMIETGYVGQESHAFSGTMDRTAPRSPRVTYTTGFNARGEHFGDPHALVNDTEYSLQVCAFLAINAAQAEGHLNIFRLLGARMPGTPS
jgi:hypothetical protein